MSDENEIIADDGIKRTPAEDSTWGKFLLKSIELDGKKYPRGWHWFCAFKYLSDVDLTLVQEKLPNEHPFKSGNVHDFFEVTKLKRLVKWLKKQLKIEKIENIDFSELIFKNADFANFIFPVKVSFEGAHFYEEVDFRYAFFLDAVNFSGTVFNKKAVFVWAIFNTKLLFCKAVFTDGVFFIGAKFFGSVNFADAKFNSGVTFSDTVFFDEAFFDGIKTSSHTDFFNTKFKSRAPSMHDAVLYSGIEWDRNVDLWPHPPKREENESYRDYKERITNNQTIYENLAFHMKKLDKYHDEHFFFRQEMRCRRVFENIFVSFPYAVYDAVSDYGYSIGKAFSCWLGHIILGAFVIRINTEKSCNNICDLADNFYLDLAVSFSNAHGLLPFHNGPLKRCYEHFAKDDIFNIIWGVQTVVGIPFLFLLLLTLRIRFRLK